MEAMLAHLWDISIQAAVIFCVLLLVRGLFSLCRAPKKCAYALWGILFIRLLLPVQLESALGFMPSGSSIMEAATSLGDAVTGRMSGTIGKNSGEAGQSIADGGLYGKVENTVKSYGEVQGAGPAQTGKPGGELSPGTGGTAWTATGERMAFAENFTQPESIAEVLNGPARNTRLLSGIWLGGAGVLFLYSIVSYGRLRKKVRCSMPLQSQGGFSTESAAGETVRRQRKNIYLADEINTPFVMGLIFPKIYLPSSMKKENLPYVIAHEQIHIARRDYLIKMAAYVIACFYWFHPLVWLGFALMCRDMEMSCDEAAVKRLGEDSRGAYAESLLLLSCKTGRLAGAPLAFGEGNTEGRIKHIMKNKKQLAAVAAAAVFLIGMLAVGLLTGPEGEPGGGTGAAESRIPEEPDGEMIGTEVPLPGKEKANAAPKEEINYTVLEIQTPVISLSDTLGADGPVLDYAKNGIVVFHGYFGLYVYSEEQGRVIGSVDLQSIGCGATQGDSYCEMYVAADGSAVYLHPLGNHQPCIRTDKAGNEKTGISDFGYVYDVEKAQLSKMEYSLFDSSGKTTSEIFRSMTGAELFDSGELKLTEGEPSCRNQLEMGVQSYQCSVIEEEGAVIYGYLESVDGTIEALVYMEKKVNSDGSSENKCVRLFGGEPWGSSTATYGSGTKITIDGVSYEMTERKSMINAIMGIQYGDGFWIVEGHISPTTGSYSLYNTQSNSWQIDIFGTCLTWEKLEGAALGDSIQKTAVYAQEYAICNYGMRIAAWVSWEYMGQGEYIRRLIRNGDTVLIQIQTATEEIRELQFSYSDWQGGPPILPRPVE